MPMVHMVEDARVRKKYRYIKRKILKRERQRRRRQGMENLYSHYVMHVYFNTRNKKKCTRIRTLITSSVEVSESQCLHIERLKLSIYLASMRHGNMYNMHNNHTRFPFFFVEFGVCVCVYRCMYMVYFAVYTYTSTSILNRKVMSILTKFYIFGYDIHARIQLSSSSTKRKLQPSNIYI